MRLAGLALRNVRRNTRRSVLSMVAVVAGVTALVVGRGFISGLTENIVRSQIDAVSGHVMIRPVDEHPELGAHTVEHLFVVDDALRAALDAAGGAWTERLLFTPSLVSGADVVRVRAIGVDPARDPGALPRDTWRVVGEVPDLPEEGVLLGAGVARLLELEPGDVVVLQTRTPEGAINALRMPVAGVVSASNPWVDNQGVVLPLELARTLLLAPGRSSHVAVRLGTRDEVVATAFAQGLAPVLPEGTETTTWRVEVDDLLTTQRIRERALGLLVLALLGISATGIANTVLMAAYERVREIGTLRAMGMSDRSVAALFLLEGAVLGVGGATVGVVLGLGVVGWISVRGIDLTEVASAAAGGQIPISTVLYASFDPIWGALAWVFGVGVATLASVLPARVAIRMSPAEAVRR